MSLDELLLLARSLSHADKLRLIQILVIQLAHEEGVFSTTDGKTYSVWTPYDAFDAAALLLKELEMSKATA